MASTIGPQLFTLRDFMEMLDDMRRNIRMGLQ